MALMICPDCGNKVSDTAESCIYCGCDLFIFKEEQRLDDEMAKHLQEFEKRMKPPKQISSLSEIPMYRNEGSMVAFIFIIAIGALFGGFLLAVNGEDSFLCAIFWCVGSAVLIMAFLLKLHSNKLLKEEQERIQQKIENFDNRKELEIEAHRARLIQEKEQKLEKIKNERQRRVYQTEAPNGLRCPICGNTQIQKLSTLNRVVSVELVGLASSKIGKQYKCKKCGHLW